MSLEIDLGGQVALVTGGTKGVGRGIVARLADAGATVVTCGRTPPEPGTLPEGVDFEPCDVRDPEAVDGLVERIASRHGHLDIAVNNAGGAPFADAATASPRFTTRIVELNLLSAVWVAQAANRVMQNNPGGGSIINIGSVSAHRPSPGTAAYGAAKAGLVSLTRSLAVEWSPLVRVNCVSVGLVRTESAHLHYGDEAGVERVAATIPAGRLADPTDIGNLCAFLASPLSSYVTGADLVIHGGGERPAFLAAALGT